MKTTTNTVTVTQLSDKDRYKEYLICQERGHGPTAMVLTSNPPWNVCSKCGTSWRDDTHILESNVPVQPGLSPQEDE